MRILAGMPEKGARGGPPACEPPFVQQLRALGVEVVEETYAYATLSAGLAGRLGRVLNTAKRLRQQVRQNQFDIVHINTSFDKRALWRDLLVVSALRASRAKIFLKFHGSDERLLETRNPLWQTLRHKLFQNVAGIGVLSSAELASFANAGVPERQVFQVSNVVSQPTVPEPAGFLKRWSLPGDQPLLLFIGRFIPAKGLLDVIQACRLLRDRGCAFQLLCVGDGPARKEAEVEVRALNLGDHIRFFGYIPEEETAGFYAHSTILVFPTFHFEGFPMNIFQAAAAGAAIITTRIRAAADHLKEPDNCLWVAPRQPVELAGRIAELLSSPALRATMNENNRKLAQRFSAAAVTQEYLHIFEQLMDGSPTRVRR